MSNPENKKAQEIPDENKTDKKPKLPPEKLQNIVGVAVIGVITIALCLCGIFGGDDVKNSNEAKTNSSSVSSDSSEQSQPDLTTTTTTTASATQSETDSSSEETSTTTTTTTTTQSSSPETTKATTKKEDKTTTTTTTTASSKETTTTTTTTKKTTTTTTTTTKKQSQSGKLTATAKISNSWQGADGFYAQVDVSAKNNTSKDLEGWTIKISVPSGTEISSSWNGDFTVSGGYIIIKPADYNGTIGAGATLSDIGLIIKTTGEFTPKATIE